MKRPVVALTDAQLERFPIVDLVEGWWFRVDERSIGCYVVEGTDRWGRKIFKEGSDEEALLRDGVEAARAIQKQLDAL
jgi:hypothetical protein